MPLGLLRVAPDLRAEHVPQIRKDSYRVTVNGRGFVDAGNLRNELLRWEPLPPLAGAEIVFVHPFANYLTDPSAYLDLSAGCWIFPFFYLLRDEGYPVALSTDFVEGKINVAPGTVLRLCARERRGIEALRMRCRTVFCWNEWSAMAPNVEGLFHIKQNPTALRPRGDMFFHLFERPLKPRLASRGDALGNVVYMGCEWNLDRAFKSPEFARRLRELNVPFRIVGAEQAEQWADFSDVDLALAVRPQAESPHDQKPASKLVNAWRAGVPMLAGYESAYAALGRYDEDVLLARTVEEAVAHVERLRLPENYARARRAVLARQAEYSDARIAARYHAELRALVGAL